MSGDQVSSIVRLCLPVILNYALDLDLGAERIVSNPLANEQSSMRNVDSVPDLVSNVLYL